MLMKLILSTALASIFCCCLWPTAGVSAQAVEAGKVSCYVCDNCNSVSIATTKIEAGKYCKKSVLLGDSTRSAVDSCTAIPKMTYCCQTHLCNSAAGLITKKRLGLHAATAAIAAVSAARLMLV